MTGAKSVTCSEYDGSDPRLVVNTTGNVRYIDIEDDTLYYSQVDPKR